MRWLSLVVAVLLALAVAAPASAQPFPKSRNYMSAAGYARWQTFLATGRWLPVGARK